MKGTRPKCEAVRPWAVVPCAVRQPHAMMATPAEERLWKKIEEVEEKRDAVEAELKNADGAERERLQLRLIELDGQLKGYISKLPAAPGML